MSQADIIKLLRGRKEFMTATQISKKLGLDYSTVCVQLRRINKVFKILRKITEDGQEYMWGIYQK